MIEQKTPRNTPMPRPPRADCCAEIACETGLRNNYFVGKRLTPDALRVEQKYLIERRQLMNRAIYGAGVVYGYSVTPDDASSGGIVVGAGLALDPVGRELVHVNADALTLDDLVVLDEKGKPYARTSDNAAPPWKKSTCYLLRVHYAEVQLGSRTLTDPCSCERKEWDQVCETVRFSLQLLDDCAECCEQQKCGLSCECGKGGCCDESRKDVPTGRPDGPVRRGGCRCLCEHLTGFSPGFESPCLTEWKETCGSVFIDLGNGVPLACVKMTPSDCDSWGFDSDIEACGPRQLVKRNDLLFDLIRGCDLTRIIEIGWKDWHRREEPVPFDEFSDALGPEGEDESEYVTKAFWVKFSRPVRKETLRPDCFAMTVMTVEGEGGWWQPFRVPIIRVDTDSEPSDPSDQARSARIVVEGGWLEDGVRGRWSHFLGDDDIQVEIEIRGDFIVDCNGQTVDANAVGLWPFPTGNGVPGCTFISTFRVAPRVSQMRGASSQSTQRARGGRP